LVLISHNETVLSPEPDTNIQENGYQLIEFTESTWPLKVNLLAFVYTMSQSLIEWSIEHEIKKSPESWNSHFQTGYPCSEYVV
jgi:hypothetical protein